MFTITHNDLNDLERVSTETLTVDLTTMKNELKVIEDTYSIEEISKNQELREDIEEKKLWIYTYETIIRTRTIITTPPVCIGCKEGQLNQQGHFGGCLPDPYTLE